ncbi:MAG: 2-isopropylmalate synthase [Planctomycetes bacterium]|nr:2-isopropylmalate synthase [Planctomycetota bacterium]
MPTEPRREDLIYDWNTVDAPPKPTHKAAFDDESLRDGLQSPSVRNPTIAQKIEILHRIHALGIDSVNLGLPGAGAHAVAHVEALAREIVSTKMAIDPNCAARTLEADIRPVAEIQQRTGLSLESAVFLGSSQIRLLVEEWDIRKLLKLTIDAVTFAKKEGLRVMYVTEDTTRTHPDIVDQLYRAAIEHGASRVVVCDTVGHSTPNGVRKLVSFVKDLIRKTNPSVQLDWHGHRDRGLDVINAITAYEAGCDRLHGAGIGIGERAGNCPMDTLLVNMKLLGYIDNDLRGLMEYVRAVSTYTEVPIPKNYPVVGSDAFETATGVHAAAVIKALARGDTWLANRVYSGVPADEFGLEQVITVGPMSGKSNCVFWLQRHGFEATDDRVDRVFRAAKQANKVLTDAEIRAALTA